MCCGAEKKFFIVLAEVDNELNVYERRGHISKGAGLCMGGPEVALAHLLCTGFPCLFRSSSPPSVSGFVFIQSFLASV